MYIMNLFNSDKGLKEKFKLNGLEPIIIGDFEEVKKEENNLNVKKEDIVDYLNKFKLHNEAYYGFSEDKLLIKAFSYESNLDIYDFLKDKTEEIKMGIKILRIMNPNADIKVASKNKVNEIDFKAPSKEIIEFDKVAFVKEYFHFKNISEVLILDLLDIVYLGEVFIKEKQRDYVYITVFGEAVNANKIAKVKIGTKVREVFNEFNGNENKLGKIVSGGVIKGYQKVSLDDEIIEKDRSLLFLSVGEEKRRRESPCIRCSKCLRICPKGLNLIKIIELWKVNNEEEFIKFGGENCIECGLCTYICPANIELSHKICTAKKNYTKKSNNEEVRSEELV
ncbi:4Fe-4S dicluster domain-containing protein [Clostridium massiliamazoniense]|uniref:4Fe-4S dicluster domain-containing protein n=1 Tax=Clostridium massiliamazoniense TaxID=1347366 RepID=UPI0006D7EA9E|nr:4Fe-4S dicluster domain-containing protein [Clostridium massiliamazoniense]